MLAKTKKIIYNNPPNTKQRITIVSFHKFANVLFNFFDGVVSASFIFGTKSF